MQEHSLYRIAVYTLFALTPITLLALRFIVAPYGRLFRTRWGPTLPPWPGWIYMEPDWAVAHALCAA